MHEKISKILNSKVLLQVLGALVVIAALLSFVYQINMLKRQGGSSVFSSRPYNNNAPIQSWMSLNYIAKVYHIPPTYLQEKLSILPGRYKHMTVEGYAKENYITTAQAIEKIQQAVSSYFTVPTP